jgi:hypothetical protein
MTPLDQRDQLVIGLHSRLLPFQLCPKPQQACQQQGRYCLFKVYKQQG